jgi:hypothetical protein
MVWGQPLLIASVIDFDLHFREAIRGHPSSTKPSKENCEMSKRASLVCQHLENISREALEKYQDIVSSSCSCGES